MLTPCKTCGNTERYKDGKCKHCVRQRVYAYQNSNPEKVSEWRKKYKKMHADQIRTAWSEYYEKNKEKISKYHSVRREDPEIAFQLRAYKKLWKFLNPGKVAIQQHNRRALVRGINGKLSKNITEILWAKQNGLCVYCNVDLSTVTVHVDHIMPLALGGTNTDANVQLTCASCNYKKHTKHPSVFKQILDGLL